MNLARQRQALEKWGKLLVCANIHAMQQGLLDAARLNEWNNYLLLGAAMVISREEAERFAEDDRNEAAGEVFASDVEEDSSLCHEEAEVASKASEGEG